MKNTLTYTTLILALLTALSVSAGNNENNPTGSISIETIEAMPGEIVNVAVTATGFAGVAAFDCYITFDKHVLDTLDLASTVVNLHPSIAGAFYNVINGNIIALTWNSMNPVTIPDGQKLFDLQFVFCSDLYPCALSGTASAIEFLENQTHFTTADFIEIDLEYIHGGVYAVNPLRALTITLLGEGVVNVDNVAYSEPLVFTEDVTLTLEAFPALDYFFDGWSGDIQGIDNPVELLMDENKVVQASFLEDLPELYTLGFVVTNIFDEIVEDAVIVLEGESHQQGYYIFDDLEPGTYTYAILHPCYVDVEEATVVIDDDLEISIQLDIFPGDANGDSVINVLDVITMANYYTANDPHPFCFYNADINQDGAVNVMDIIQLIGLF